MIYYQYMESPIGKFLVAGDGKKLHHINFTGIPFPSSFHATG